MTPNNNISNELKDLNVSLPVVSMPEMSLPEAYFNNLETEILAEIRTSEFLASFPKTTPFEVPRQYFENLATDIVANTMTENFLSFLPKHNPYHIPAGYFENLTDTIISKTVRVNTIQPLRATRTFYSRMAIAASVFIVLSIGFMMMTKNTISRSSNIEAQLAQLSDAEIENYIQDYQYEFDNDITFQTIDESKIDLNKLENEIYGSYLDNLTDEELNNLL